MITIFRSNKWNFIWIADGNNSNVDDLRSFAMLRRSERKTWNNSGLGPVSRKSRDFSGDIILFVSSKRRCFVTWNFALILIFTPVTTYKKISFTEWAGRSFTNGFSGPKSLPDFRETGAWTRLEPDLLNAGEVLHQLSCQANWVLGSVSRKPRNFSDVFRMT